MSHSTLGQYISVVGIACLACVSVVCAQEQSPPPPSLDIREAEERRMPEWKADFNAFDTSPFRTIVEVPYISVSVPTVVEVPVSGMIRNEAAIVRSESGVISPATIVTHRERLEVSLSVTTQYCLPDEFSLCAAERELMDADVRTTVDFPFEESFDREQMMKSQNTATVTFFSSDGTPFTASGLHVQLAPYVALPRTVKITALNAAGMETVVVAERAMTSPEVYFPSTTAVGLKVTFGLAQPLRLAEARIMQHDASVEVQYGIRFLAQPGEAYTIYMDPDQQHDRVLSGGVDLMSDTGVLLVSEGMPVPNSGYTPADSDADGVPDERDNCVSLANTDQRDYDGNGRGDMCDDFDRDGVLNSKDSCPDAPNRDQRDTDGDGAGDVCDDLESRFTEANPWIPWAGMLIAATVIAGLMVLVLKQAGRREDQLEQVKVEDAQ